ncbi:DUF6585 family protein [Nocardia sp. NPDC051030]|uniref:DUF6585 family protein n=1 Tax=Nocardia sp. NPDC051030 TaxID=3155162 RepID=UPI00343BF3C5
MRRGRRERGAQVTVDQSFANVERWGAEIQESVTRTQLPIAAARVRAGELVEFGDLWITANEVGSRRKSASWSTVGTLDLTRGYVAVGIEGKLFDLTVTPVSKIPNFFVFQALFDHLRSHSQGRISTVE